MPKPCSLAIRIRTRNLVLTNHVWSVRADCADWEPAASSCFGSWSIPAILRTKKRGAGQWQVPERREKCFEDISDRNACIPSALRSSIRVFFYVSRCTLLTVSRWEQTTACHVQQIWKVCSTELFQILAISVISSSCLITEIPLSCLNSNYWWNCASCSIRHLPGRLGCMGGTSNALLFLGNSFFSCFTEKLVQCTVPVFHSTGICVIQVPSAGVVFSVQGKQTVKSILRLVLHEGSLLLLI